MKGFTKFLAIALALALALSCGLAFAEADPASFICSDEPLELTAHIHWGGIYVLNDSWSIINKAAELTNVQLKGTASVNETDSVTAYNLMISTGQLPDMVGNNTLNDANKYGMEGAFQPLNELIAEYAPNLDAFLEANPVIKAGVTAADGNIYAVPFVYETKVSLAWMIREDWLNKLNLEVPTTVDELYNVLTAFRTQDPNGNGEMDEIPLFARGTDVGVAKGVLGLFGVNPDWYVGEDGKIGYGRYTAEYQTAISMLSKWYAEGLIDPEFYTRGGQSREMLFPEDNGGIIHDWIPSTTAYNDKLSEYVPDFHLIGILPPADVDGVVWEPCMRLPLTGSCWSISATNAHPVESMKYMDFWWSETGRQLSTYGIEGDTYTMVDGKPMFTDKVLKASTSVNDYIRKLGGMIDVIGYLHDASYEYQMMAEPGPEITELYQNSGVVGSYKYDVPTLSFTEEELELVTEKFTTCKTYMDEQQMKWTHDGSSIENDYATYMSTLASMGMDEIVAVYQTAYDRLMAAVE